MQIVDSGADLPALLSVRLRAQVLLAVVDRVLQAVLLVGDLAEVDQEVGELGQAVAGLELDAGGFVVAGLIEVDDALNVVPPGLHSRGCGWSVQARDREQAKVRAMKAKAAARIWPLQGGGRAGPRSICEFGRDNGAVGVQRHGGLATVVKGDAPALQRFLDLLEGVVVRDASAFLEVPDGLLGDPGCGGQLGARHLEHAASASDVCGD